MKTLKRKVSFIDANNNRQKVELEITTRNGYFEFTCSGESGQCQDRISPDGEFQELLIELWNKYHLNGMNAGTEKQLNILKKSEEKMNFDEQKEFLSSHDIDGNELSILKINKNQKELNKFWNEIRDLKLNLNNLIEFENEFKKANPSNWNKTDNYFAMNFLSTVKENLGNSVYHFKKVEEFRTESRYFKQSILSVLPRKFFEFKKEIENSINKIQEKIDKIILQTALYDIDENTNQIVKYGSTWIKKNLPDDFDKTIIELCDEIENEEKEKKLSKTKVVDHGKEDVEQELLDQYYDAIDEPILALAFYLDMSIEDLENIEKSKYGYGDCLYEAQGTQYYIGTEDEIKEAVTDYIKDTAWAFNPSFLSEKTGIPQEAFKSLSELCKNGNDGILAIIEKTCGLESFVDASIAADSIGHFLNGYDGLSDTFEYNGETYTVCRT